MPPSVSFTRLRAGAGLHSRALVGILIFALTAALAFGARDSWNYARTENFEILSAASEKRTRQLVVELEQFRASFIATFGLRPAHEPRVTIVLFNSERQFRPYLPLYNGKPKEVSGYFISGADEATIALSAEYDPDIQDPTETILHEYVHFLLHSRGLQLPTWLNEGMAELFSTFRVNGEFVEYGLPKDLYVMALNVSSLMTLPRLMAVTESSPDYNEEHRAGMFYAQSWALTHYLVCGTDRSNAERLSRFLERIDSPTNSPDALFREVFGKEFDLLPQKLRAYLEGGRYYQRRAPALLKNLAARIVVRPATEFERDYALLNLRWRLHRSGDAMLAALQLAEKFPESPRPHELLAAIAAADGDYIRAFERCQQAAELDSENPFIYVQAARSQLRDLDLNASPDLRLSADTVPLVRKWVDRATTKSPRFDAAWETLALVEARAPEFRIPAINEIQQHVTKLKDPNPTLLALALIRWRAKDVGTASNITKAILESTIAKPDTKAAARLLQLHFSDASAHRP